MSHKALTLQNENHAVTLWLLIIESISRNRCKIEAKLTCLVSIFHMGCQSVDLGHRLDRDVRQWASCHTGVVTPFIALVKVLPCSSRIFGDLKPSCWAAATGHELPSVENLLDGQILTCNPMQGRPLVRVEAMICLTLALALAYPTTQHTVFQSLFVECFCQRNHTPPDVDVKPDLHLRKI